MKISKKQFIFLGGTMGIVFLIGVVCMFYFNKNGDDFRGVESFNVENIGDSSYNVAKNDNIDLGQNNENNNNGEIMGNKSASPDNPENLIYIHIIGEVANQGVITLNKGQRIIDAIEKAGGATGNADLNRINLAYVLSDGQKIKIPSIYDNEDNGQGDLISGGGSSYNGGGTDMGMIKVNINTASQTELETIVGVGPSLAAKIINYREKNGRFRKIEELKNVSGIGDVKFEELKNYVDI